MDSHIFALVGLLENNAEEIAKMKNHYEVGIQCVGYYTDENPGFHLSEELINKCAKLGVALDFDLYCIHSENDDAV